MFCPSSLQRMLCEPVYSPAASATSGHDPPRSVSLATLITRALAGSAVSLTTFLTSVSTTPFLRLLIPVRLTSR
ncbi:hypothetical protein PR202_gb16262 [Eleusine coracana subsp. coracana]|uniref:Uncharacterized protein n=1 Tax=Eleusine coracana subsp. coracana TaxID=191504 RepID=A0AAV5EXN3_ELECO|nr:hypothetical protein PR202_gb16262 [Eleusine coracana subsp. coracana]